MADTISFIFVDVMICQRIENINWSRKTTIALSNVVILLLQNTSLRNSTKDPDVFVLSKTVDMDNVIN